MDKSGFNDRGKYDFIKGLLGVIMLSVFAFGVGMLAMYLITGNQEPDNYCTLKGDQFEFKGDCEVITAIISKIETGRYDFDIECWEEPGKESSQKRMVCRPNPMGDVI